MDSYWTRYGQVLELSVEGNRLIALEIVSLMRAVWRRVVASVEGLVRREMPRV